ncbi:ImmA/IrrE family metallo-endopeptidase [Salinisphaera sp. Q1T1-3]|uniref:ImmA/IrrE family metallo-endopeptidase n=1 Tax=Salinisphaera sp. Q1T1-3 TaxID=2321229 RepID=UPI000E758C48|nr:ImmA/IrrE family metallo-endopeptidase [Salinisphaera sp. Q1T1-3]RJS93555.1 ImmA/IrrE family metallo-endopeptidase [Salinisphaera sp. Q1T1-3]
MPSSEQISASRKLLQNPYAYLDDIGGFSALPVTSKGAKKQADRETIKTSLAKLRNDISVGKRLSDNEIALAARWAHKQIWQSRDLIWGTNLPKDRAEMINAAELLGLIGYRVNREKVLGQFMVGGQRAEVAGILDRDNEEVHISPMFDPEVCNFTLAHEVGHVLLHEGTGLHRDRALDGTSSKLRRVGIEYEADKFASYFLMPEKTLKAKFKKFFGTELFVINEVTAFAFQRDTVSAFKSQHASIRALARKLASAESYDGKRFNSLAAQFGVSVEAMAIRMEELNLVQY